MANALARRIDAGGGGSSPRCAVAVGATRRGRRRARVAVRAASAARASVGAADARAVSRRTAGRGAPRLRARRAIGWWTNSVSNQVRRCASWKAECSRKTRPWVLRQTRSHRAGGRGSTGNLRERLTSFVGREADIERLQQSLADHRLITLIGPGDRGRRGWRLKYPARQQSEFPDGAWFVELAAVRDGDGVAPAMYAALRVGEFAANKPERPADPVVDQPRHLADRTLIVVLNNCEHVTWRRLLSLRR